MSTKETLPLTFEHLTKGGKHCAYFSTPWRDTNDETEEDIKAITHTRLDAAEKELEKIKLRNLANVIKQICDECGHTKTEDGCAFCIKQANAALAKELADVKDKFDDADLAAKTALEAHEETLRELTQLKEANAELVKDRERVSKLANLIWQTRWVSEDSDYQDLVGIAAEIRSGNFNGIDAAITKGTL